MQTIVNNIHLEGPSKVVGTLQVLTGDVAELLSLDVSLPSFKSGKKIGGTIETDVSAFDPSLTPPGLQFFLLPAAGYTWAITLPPTWDLNGDGTVDGADLGKAMTNGALPAAIGELLSQWGSSDLFVTAASIALIGGGSFNGSPWPLDLPCLPVSGEGVLRIRANVSPKTKVTLKFNVDCDA